VEKEQCELDNVINEVKEQLQRMLTEKKKLIKKLGNAYEKVVSNQESICEEIKNALKSEVTEGLISNRLIEMYCPENWKKKRRPKKQKENEKFSLSKKMEHTAVENGNGMIHLQEPSEDGHHNIINFPRSNENTDSDGNKNSNLDNERQEIDVMTHVKLDPKAVTVPEKFIINKDKKNLIDIGLDDCIQYCSLTFNESGVLISVTSDRSVEVQ